MSSPTAIIHNLKWPPLQQRRAQAKAVMMYRIVNGFVAIPAKSTSSMHRTGQEVMKLDSYSRSRECRHTNNRCFSFGYLELDVEFGIQYHPTSWANHPSKSSGMPIAVSPPPCRYSTSPFLTDFSYHRCTNV